MTALASVSDAKDESGVQNMNLHGSAEIRNPAIVKIGSRLGHVPEPGGSESSTIRFDRRHRESPRIRRTGVALLHAELRETLAAQADAVVAANAPHVHERDEAMLFVRGPSRDPGRARGSGSGDRFRVAWARGRPG